LLVANVKARGAPQPSCISNTSTPLETPLYTVPVLPPLSLPTHPPQQVVIDSFTYLPTTSSLLRLRFAELYPVVDRFLVILGTHSHSGEPLAHDVGPGWGAGGGDWWGYGDKVNVVNIDLTHTLGVQGDEGGQVREEIQRDATTAGVGEVVERYFPGTKAEDVVVMVGDSDEFVRRDRVEEIRRVLGDGRCGNVHFRLKWHLYSLDWIAGDGVWGVVAREVSRRRESQNIESGTGRNLTSPNLTSSLARLDPRAHTPPPSPFYYSPPPWSPPQTSVAG